MKITIANAATGEVFRNLDGTKEQGINSVQWNLRGNPPPRPAGQIAGGGGGGGGGGFGGQQQGPLAEPGLYRVTLTVEGRGYTRLVEVEEDRWLSVSGALKEPRGSRPGLEATPERRMVGGRQAGDAMLETPHG